MDSASTADERWYVPYDEIKPLPTPGGTPAVYVWQAFPFLKHFITSFGESAATLPKPPTHPTLYALTNDPALLPHRAVVPGGLLGAAVVAVVLVGAPARRLHLPRRHLLRAEGHGQVRT